MSAMTGKMDTLISGLVEDLEPVRPFRFSRGLGLALGGFGLALLLAVTLGVVRPDVAAGHPAGIFLLANGLFLLLGLACAAAVVSMASPRVGNPRNGWGWAVAMAGLLPISAGILALIEGTQAWQASEPGHGVICLAFACVLGLFVAGALVAWLRRGAPTSPQLAGLLTGIAAGCGGVFAFSFVCTSNAIMHIGLWHGLAVTISAAAGRLIVPPMVRW